MTKLRQPQSDVCKGNITPVLTQHTIQPHSIVSDALVYMPGGGAITIRQLACPVHAPQLATGQFS
jgi:hypothetical protein